MANAPRTRQEILTDIAAELNSVTNSKLNGEWVAHNHTNHGWCVVLADKQRTPGVSPFSAASQWTANDLNAFTKTFGTVDAQSSAPIFVPGLPNPFKISPSQNNRVWFRDFASDAEAERFLKWLQTHRKDLQDELTLRLSQNPGAANNNSAGTGLSGSLRSGTGGGSQNQQQFSDHALDVIDWFIQAKCRPPNRLFDEKWLNPNAPNDPDARHGGIEFAHANTVPPAFAVVPGSKGAEVHVDMTGDELGLRQAVMLAVALHGDKLEFEGSHTDRQKMEAIMRDMHSKGHLCGPNGLPLANPPQITRHVLPVVQTSANRPTAGAQQTAGAGVNP